MFGFNFDNTVSTRTTAITLVYNITCYHTTVVLFIFETLFCLPAKRLCHVFLFVSNFCFYLHDFQTFKYHLNYCSPVTDFFMLYDVPDSSWGVLDVRCSRCGMLGMWDVWDVECCGCWIFGMWHVRDM